MSRTLKKTLKQYIMYYLYKKKHVGSIEKNYLSICKKSQKVGNIIDNLSDKIMMKY